MISDSRGSFLYCFHKFKNFRPIFTENGWRDALRQIFRFFGKIFVESHEIFRGAKALRVTRAVTKVDSSLHAASEDFSRSVNSFGL